MVTCCIQSPAYAGLFATHKKISGRMLHDLRDWLSFTFGLFSFFLTIWPLVQLRPRRRKIVCGCVAARSRSGHGSS